ncbi:MAG: hypothetical protein CAPSK01_004004 [Candidatus Accumulibacter vicinus]|uniref:Uncharacterized protein n=1 Tax=Candidatus Accumulibacter vicinus TaxID=2954382 RepID=A0A084XVZ5_9PROT|nr:MAG: hypothetical protein CAPSK01_004004 [Candidatus Accumulibacter vicinus]
MRSRRRGAKRLGAFGFGVSELGGHGFIGGKPGFGIEPAGNGGGVRAGLGDVGFAHSRSDGIQRVGEFAVIGGVAEQGGRRVVQHQQRPAAHRQGLPGHGDQAGRAERPAVYNDADRLIVALQGVVDRGGVHDAAARRIDVDG